MSNFPKNVQINNISQNNYNPCIHICDSAPMEEETNFLKQNLNQNSINLQSIQTNATSEEFNNQLINDLNDSISDKTLSENDEGEIYSYENEYYTEVYKNLILDENYFYQKINPNYMSFQKDINYKMRAILVDWLIDVHFHCNFKQKTLFHSIFIIDALLSKIQINKINFQLVGTAALLISCKENEIMYPSLKKFAELTDNAYSVNQIVSMEKKILKILKFDIFTPTSEEFYHINAEYFDFNEEQKYFGYYFLESSLIDSHLLKYKMSTVAISCVYIVMKYYKLDKVHLVFDNCAPNVKQKEVKNCARDLCFLVKNLSNSSLGAIKNKYINEKFLKVAELCEKK